MTIVGTLPSSKISLSPNLLPSPQSLSLNRACPSSSIQLPPSSYKRNFNKHLLSKPRVFFLDVNPICYSGSQPSLRSFAHWVSLLFSQVTLDDPVIAVLDGEGGNEYRRKLMPSYKAHRRKGLGKISELRVEISDVLRKCHVPVIKVGDYEADDVVATLTEKVLKMGFRVVIGSPDKDFKQLISEDVQLAMPMPEFGRWSFYTLRHYIAQYNCDPSSDLSLRCLLGDEVDGVPGIQDLVPGFGRKTALKLLKKHGSLENLLNTASIRTVGKHYAQDALNKHADFLRKNFEVLSLRRDANIHFEEKWLSKRDTCNDTAVLSSFMKSINETQKNANSQRRRQTFERRIPQRDVKSVHAEDECMKSVSHNYPPPFLWVDDEENRASSFEADA